MKRLAKHGAVLLVLSAALLVPFSAPAVAAKAPTPCWQLLMNQWYSGEIKTIFPLDCYHQAIQHLPTDIQVYSSARDDITKALQAAIAYDAQQKAAAAAAAAAAAQTTTTSTGTTPTTTTKHIVVPVIKTHGPGAGAAPILSTINSASPGGATSFPLPLIILGALAILLVAAGGIGLYIRRRQGPGPGTA
jgi:hypothetical protein